MRKVIIVICLVATLVCLAAPAFAASHGGTGSVIKESAFRIDAITFNDGPFVSDIYEWPFNLTRAWSTPVYDVNEVGGGALTWTESGYRDGSVSGVFVPNSCTSFALYSRELLLSDSVFASLSQNIPDDLTRLYITDIRFNGRVNYISEYNDRYYVDTQEFYRTYKLDGVDSVSLSDLLRSCVSSTKVAESDSVLITNLYINIDFYWEGPGDNRSWYFKSSANDMVVYDSQKWFNSQALKYRIVDPDYEFNMVNWLKNSVGSFLEFELFPGFSIDKIFWLILVIGILLWFFKLII